MKFIWHDGAWREAVRVTRPSAFPAIHRDTMSLGFHPGSGRPTDSKGEWRAWNREHGFTEMGTDAPTERKVAHDPAVTKHDLHEAIQMLQQGYKPAPLETLHEGEFSDAEVRAL